MQKNSEKIKILFDSNVYDVLVAQGICSSFFDKNNLEVIGTKINEVEHSKIPKEKSIKKNRLKNKLNEISKVEKRGVAHFGFAEDPTASGFGTLNNNLVGGYFIDFESKNFIEKQGKKQENDRSLIVLAKNEYAIFITYDERAYKVASKANVKALLLNHDNDNNIALDLEVQINATEKKINIMLDELSDDEIRTIEIGK